MDRKNQRRLGLAAIALLLVSCSEPFEPLTETEVRSIVHEVTDRHDTPRPPVYVSQDTIRFKDDSLAETVCDRSSQRCEVNFLPCSLENRSIEELSVHEAAHVVVAWKYDKYDHGKEWKSLMAEEGYRNANSHLHNRKC